LYYRYFCIVSSVLRDSNNKYVNTYYLELIIIIGVVEAGDAAASSSKNILGKID